MKNAPRQKKCRNAAAGLTGRFAANGLVLLMLMLSGCGLLRFPASQPTARVGSLTLGTNKANSVSLVVLEAQVMRFADQYVATLAQTSDDLSAKTTNSDLRLTLLRWKLGQATSAYIDATGANPALNALDMLVLVTMARMVVEEYGVETYGNAVLPLLQTQRQLETNAWTLAEGVLQPKQEAQLKQLIQEWRAKHPHQRYIGPIRFREFVAALGIQPTQAKTAPTSLFSLLYLDPLAGLDPTAAAIQETRQLGERAMFYSQRMPMLLSWQTEALAYQIARQPESQQVLADATRLSESVQIFARTAQQLPGLINDQRQAAIQQILDGLRSQDVEVRQTLYAGSDAAKAINRAIQSLDQFVRYVSPPGSNSAPLSTNSKPFNVLDYGTAASQVGAAAKELNVLLTTVNQSTPRISQLGQQTADDANRVVDHAFRLGLVLILLFLAGAVVAGLIYRILAEKLTLGRREPLPPDSESSPNRTRNESRRSN
jgi:hypothetical protein